MKTFEILLLVWAIFINKISIIAFLGLGIITYLLTLPGFKFWLGRMILHKLIQFNFYCWFPRNQAKCKLTSCGRWWAYDQWCQVFQQFFRKSVLDIFLFKCWKFYFTTAGYINIHQYWMTLVTHYNIKYENAGVVNQTLSVSWRPGIPSSTFRTRQDWTSFCYGGWQPRRSYLWPKTLLLQRTCHISGNSRSSCTVPASF